MFNELESFLGMEETGENDDYSCILLGQFSSGKTRFLNRLIGKDMLPVGTSEMTAAPTYFRKGDLSVKAFCGDGRVEELPLEELKKIKKGACNYERIEVTLPDFGIPEKISCVDTPGTNSIFFKTSDSEIMKADVILYFLAKSVSAYDVETINRIRTNAKKLLIFVRTRIDDIRQSEENIFETFKDEQDLIRSLYPNSRFYFISLEDEACEQNQLTQLLEYINNNLAEELYRRRQKSKKEYIDSVLKPRLIQMKDDIICNERKETIKNNLVKSTQRQLKTIKKAVDASLEDIKRALSIAKENYRAGGTVMIDKQFEIEGKVLKNDIQEYVLTCLRKLEAWYAMEFEDIVVNISGGVKKTESNKLISYAVVSRIFEMHSETRSSFVDYSVVLDEEKTKYFSRSENAKDYLGRILDSIFLKIDAGLWDIHCGSIDRIIERIGDQYKKENAIIRKYSTKSDDLINKIDSYLSELMQYENSMGII